MCWPVILSYILVFITGFNLILQDIKEYRVKISSICLFISSCIFHYYVVSDRFDICIEPFFIILSIGLFFYIFKRMYVIGAADYFVIFGVSFLFDSVYWSVFMTLCGAINCITSYILKSNKIPFIPSILISAAIIKIYDLFFIN